jgi:hypothetical protein
LLGVIRARSAYGVQHEAHPKEKQQGQCQGMSIQCEDDPTVPSYLLAGVSRCSSTPHLAGGLRLG